MCIRDRIGSAQRVPVPTGSTNILVAVVKGKDVTKESINAAMKAATSESFGYNEEDVYKRQVPRVWAIRPSAIIISGPRSA